MLVWIFDRAQRQFVEGGFDQVPVDDFVVALVVVAEQVVVGRGRVVIGIVKTADLFRRLDHRVEDLRVVNELGQDAEAAFGRFVEEDVGRLGVAQGDDADFVWLHLEDRFDGALERVFEGDDAFRLEAEGCDGLDVEGIREVRGPELHEPELFANFSLGPGMDVRQSPDVRPMGKPSAFCARHCELTWTRRAAAM